MDKVIEHMLPERGKRESWEENCVNVVVDSETEKEDRWRRWSTEINM